MRAGVESLVAYYSRIHEERFQGLPIVNPQLAVEALGFRTLAEHKIGALITPWFINLVLLPGNARWRDRAQGCVCSIELPGGKIDFTVSHDEELGTTLSAALFGSVTDFPDQAMARDVARETLELLFGEKRASSEIGGAGMTRRQLLRNLGGMGGDDQ
jgi:[NiFe] hydrogenase assembly HybE family chaperone